MPPLPLPPSDPSPGKPAEPSPLDTAEFPHEEILERLEAGRLIVEPTEGGSRLEIAHRDTPPTDRRTEPHPGIGEERRKFRPLRIPTLFPESGVILVLVMGGLADDQTLRCPIPFWGDGKLDSPLIWQAMDRAGLIHPQDTGFQEEAAQAPRTQGIALTYSGYQRNGELADFHRVIHPWNQHRIQTLIQACWERSMNRLKIITIGEAARFMACACVYGMPDIPVLSLSQPSADALVKNRGASDWVEWAADLMVVGRITEF